jgi:hypothetical protein
VLSNKLDTITNEAMTEFGRRLRDAGLTMPLGVVSNRNDDESPAGFSLVASPEELALLRNKFPESQCAGVPIYWVPRRVRPRLLHEDI